MQAWEALERGSVDCILLDVMVPGQSGLEFCRQIRKVRDTPILFLSARDEDLDKIRSDLPHIFDAFYRGENSRNPEYGGT